MNDVLVVPVSSPSLVIEFNIFSLERTVFTVLGNSGLPRLSLCFVSWLYVTKYLKNFRVENLQRLGMKVLQV